MDEWSEKDRVLAEALIEFEENAHCPGCGQLRSKAWDDSTDGWWEMSKVHCYACEAQQVAEERSSKSADKGEPGDLPFITLDD